MFLPDRKKLASLGLLAAQTLCVCKENKVPTRLMNFSDETIMLNRGTKIGYFEVMNSPNKQAHVNTINVQDNGSPLIDLFDKVERNSFLSQTEKAKAKEIFKKYKSVFSANKKDLGLHCDIKHEINIKENAPIQQVISKVPINVEEWVDQQVENLLNQNVIRKSTSPWSAPVVVVTKKTGDYRLCVDYRRLNSVTIRPTFNIPDTRVLFDALHGSTIFSCIDLSNAYYQCEVEEKHRKYTAFTTRKGHYEFNRMPFGLVGSPFTFQRLMNNILHKENWQKCLIYLDDIIIYGKSFEEHCKNLEIVLSKLTNAGMKLSPQKCNFFSPKVQYLGHVISARGVETDPNKVSAVLNWKLPETVAELRSFLGFTNYYRRFIQNYAEIVKDLERILKDSSKSGSPKKDNSKLLWNNDALKAFDSLKQHLCQAPCLAYPDKNSKFILDTDASHEAIGAVLSQVQNGEIKAIAYGSKKLSKAEIGYCITRKELFAVYHFVSQFKHYLLGRNFTIRTDHKALKWLMDWDKPNTSQYCSWIAELELYDFTIEHRQGSKHVNADFLSRPRIECQQCAISHSNPKPLKHVKILNINELDAEKDHLIELKTMHNELGHIGATKLKQLCRSSNIFWKNINKQIDEITQKCPFCQERKSPAGRGVREEISITAKKCFEKIMIDVAGPLPVTKNKNIYLLSVIDVYSRYPCLFAMRQCDANTVINILKRHWFTQFGYPCEIQTDGAKYFDSSLFRNFCHSRKINLTLSSAYHPQSNGIVERFFRRTKDMLYATSRQKCIEWDEAIPYVEMGTRSTICSSIGFSPYQVIYGFNPRVVQVNETETNNQRSHRLKILQSVEKELKEKNNQNNERRKEIKNIFSIGDRVFIRINTEKPTINKPRYFGPGIIEGIKSKKSYFVRVKGQLLLRNEIDLKKCYLPHVKSEVFSSSTSIISQPAPDSTIVQRYPQRVRQPVQRYGYGS